MDLLNAVNISKQFAAHKALTSVSISVPENSIFGLLGPNGAGKTTFIRIINQIIAPDEGEVFLEGKKLVASDIEKIGYLPEERGLYKKMHVGEMALYLAQLKGMSRHDALVKLKFWTKVEDGLAKVAVILLAGSVLGIVFGTTGLYPHRDRLYPHRHNYNPDPAMVQFCTCALVLSLILLAARLCSRHCYLLDPGRGCLIWQSQFLWFRRMRVVLERREIAGVAAQGKEFRSRRGSYWSYRVVVEKTAGGEIPVSNWRPWGRDKCQAEADKLAELLGCRGSVTLPEFTPQVRGTGSSK